MTAEDTALLAEITDAARSENRAAARKVLTAGVLWDAWIERDVKLASGKITDCGNAAVAEVAVRLSCSKTVAESWTALGVELRLRLPRTRAAFEAGELDVARVRAISRETTGLSVATVSALEPQILTAARHLSPGPLASEVERLALAHSPGEVAEQRESARAWQRRIVKRRDRGCATVEVTVSPEEGEAIMQLVAEFAGTVCRHDRRGVREKLVDSLLALVHGEPYLACTCGREDCDAPQTGGLPGRRAPLTQITVDLPTLLGLLSEPAYLHGHGGLLAPPRGALTYRPDAATAALVRARDRHCRFPSCSRPAAQCQLDHIVPYLARSPLVGGWTMVTNLQCLCAFHHQLKTLGFWQVTTLDGPGMSGHALLWTSTLGSAAVTLPGGASGVDDLARPGPRAAGRRGQHTPAPTTPPDPPPF